jgi:hypothetical protein
MDAFWFILMPFVMAAVLVVMSIRRRTDCPDCGAPWVEGDADCAECGCEVSKDVSDTSRRSSTARQWAALVVLVVIGVGLGAAMLLVGSREPAPPVVAAPQPVLVAPAVQ